MNPNRKLLSRPFPLLAFLGVAVLGALVLAQVSPQPPRQRAAPAPQYQNQNQLAPAPDQPSNQAARDPRGQTRGQNSQTADDSRQRQLAHSEEQDAAWLGVFLSERDNERGATVAHVYPSGPASRAGLQPGDVIQEIN